MTSGLSQERLFLQLEVKVHVHVWYDAVLTSSCLNYEHSTQSACIADCLETVKMITKKYTVSDFIFIRNSM